VLEECTIEEKRSVVGFLRTKGLSAKDIHKEMFPVYGGKCLSRKAIHKWVADFSLMTKRLDVGAEVTETTVKNVYDEVFDALVKRCDKCGTVFEK
jgi:hypothetical protein